MSQLLTVDELDSAGVILEGLTRGEHRALAAVGKRLHVEWRPDGSARVSPSGYVGSVQLSAGRAVAVTTKLPVANVLSLASLAYRTAPLPPSFGTGVYEASGPSDWMALLLISETEALIGAGLRSGYMTLVDELPYVRGRLTFSSAASLRRPGLATCEFSDFVADTPENRVLRAALEALAGRRLLPGLRLRLHGVLRVFRAVMLVPATPLLLTSTRISRLNQHYEPALELCRIVLSHTGLEYPGGATAAPAFFFPMAEVFEAAIANHLRHRFAGARAQVGNQVKAAGGSPSHQLTFFPDVTIGEPPVLVIDTKYARPEVRNAFGGWSFDNSHAYQVAFYAHALACPGVLVYPRTDRDVATDFTIRGTAISFLTVDLSSPGLAGLDALATELGRRALAPTGAAAQLAYRPGAPGAGLLA